MNNDLFNSVKNVQEKIGRATEPMKELVGASSMLKNLQLPKVGGFFAHP